MDFRQRNNSSPAQPTPTNNGATSASHITNKKQKWTDFVKISSIVLLFSATILLVSVLISISMGGPKQYNEGRFVDTNQLQAVFLTGGQVYFGNITTLNRDFVTLDNIYYLQVNQQVQPGEEGQEDVTLVKLGCELHGPEDRMVINQDQVIFWENLKDDGRVAQAVEQFKQNNPDGLQCEDGQPTATPENGQDQPAAPQNEEQVEQAVPQAE